MNIKMRLRVPRVYFYQQLIDSARADYASATGRLAPLALAGQQYTKHWPNGLHGTLTVTAAKAPEAYGYELTTSRGDYRVHYRLSAPEDGVTHLDYSETTTSHGSAGKANQFIGELTLGWFRKRRFKRMAKAIAANYATR